MAMNYLKLLFLSFFIIAIGCQNDDDESETDPNEEMPMPIDTLATCCELEPLNVEIGDAALYVPNAFTPNFDGINDLFYVNANDQIVEVVEMMVTDSLGVVYFMEFNFLPNQPQWGWNGTNDDGEVQQGVFNYSIKVKNADGDELEYSGLVCSRFETPLPCVDNEENCRYPTQHDGEGGLDIFLPTNETCE